MARIFEYPPILEGSVQNQINQLRDYMGRLVSYLTDAEYLSGSHEPERDREDKDE